MSKKERKQQRRRRRAEARQKVKKVLLLGSGGLSIGQAGEFDYSGSQALKALREDGIKTILINPDIATIQTSKELADKVCFLPVNAHFVEQIIKKEKPDGILLSFGGQTALNCGVELHEKGILKKHKVRVLGTPIQTIINTEDRDLFVKKLLEIDLPVPKSKAVHSIEKGLEVAEEIGYPVMARVAYALGGLGSGIARNKIELEGILKKAFSHTKQVLIEEYLQGWKEIEYEVVRDKNDNCITVCNMENMDPMGIHTGESIVVAPSQTLTNEEYHHLREISIKAIRHLGIVGECNIQFALNPASEEYRIIEVNARLSRSSALASKATGYPLAFIAAKLALGYTLIELQNSITKQTSAFFEPALDYVVVKVPRWDLKKFREVSKSIGSGMKSVGEVMAIGRNLEEAIQKAIRMLGTGMHGLVGNTIRFEDIQKELKEPTEERIYAIVEALKHDFTVEEINQLTHIDAWFLHKIANVVQTEKKLKKYALRTVPKDLFLLAKQQGFSDFQLGRLLCKGKDMNRNVLMVRRWRKRKKILPHVKQIDTLAGEFPAKTNYLYMTYNAIEDDVPRPKKSILVLGSGPYRIGSSVEFDWCCVNAVSTVHDVRYESIMINCNPETVSTDYDACDRLYFEELSFERVMDIYEREHPKGIILSMGGQTPNNLAMRLHREKVKILGTSPLMIDQAENRHNFSKLLDRLGVDQPDWKELTSLEEARKFANKVGYPVLVRPSYVLSGAAMAVAFNDQDLAQYLKKAAAVSKQYPVVLSKYVLNAKEIEIDGVAQKGDIVCHAISEHVENAGVHSGDATMVLPPQKLYLETIKKIKDTSRKIVNALKITGPFNIQYMAKDNELKVIECNLRASRSFPFVSKVMKTNFISIATRVMLNAPYEVPLRSALDLEYVAVKSPQFSFARLPGADPMLGVEMASTGEVACFGEDLYEAFLKSIISSGFKLPNTSVLVSISGDEQRYDFLGEMRLMQELGFTVYATEHTSAFLNQHRIPNTMIYKVHNVHKENNVGLFMEQGKLDLVIAVPNPQEPKFSPDHYTLRRKAVDHGIPLVVNLQVAKLFIQALAKKRPEDLHVKEWEAY